MVGWVLEGTKHMLSWSGAVARHLSVDLLGLRVCSSVWSATQSAHIWIELLLIVRIGLCVAAWSCRGFHYYLCILSVCAGFWHLLNVLCLKYGIISVVIDSIHVLQLQSLLISEIRLGPLFLASLSCIYATHLGGVSNVRLSSTPGAVAHISKTCPLISVVPLGHACLLGVVEIRQSWHVGSKSVFA